jgi:hypothetical protein
MDATEIKAGEALEWSRGSTFCHARVFLAVPKIGKCLSVRTPDIGNRLAADAGRSAPP